MTRAQMRERLERRLQDTTTETWSLAAKNELLNDGLREIQKRVIAVDPYFAIYVDQADIVASQPRIKKPLGFIYEFRLDRKESAAGEYARMFRIGDEEARQRSTTASTTKYSHDGQYFKLSPTPSASVASGFQLTWMPTLSMAADSDVPDIHIMLHLAIVIAAQLVALGDTGVAREAIAAELESHASPSVIALYYHRSAADLEQLVLEYGKPLY